MRRLCLAMLFLLPAPGLAAESGKFQENQKYVDALSGKDEKARIEAIDALGKRGIKATGKGAEALVPLLKDKDKTTRLHTIQALGAIEKEAKRATPDLMPLLEDPDKDIRDAAAKALVRIGSTRGREAAEQYLKEAGRRSPSPDQ